MALTEARTDLPYVGAKIVVLHGGGQFYVGPYTVADVDQARQIVVVHPDHWEPKRSIEYRPSRDAPLDFRWNLVTDLTEAEQAEVAEWAERGEQSHAKMMQRIGSELRLAPSKERLVSGGTYDE